MLWNEHGSTAIVDWQQTRTLSYKVTSHLPTKYRRDQLASAIAADAVCTTHQILSECLDHSMHTFHAYSRVSIGLLASPVDC